ncbi:MAG: HTTM domain-containing protein [Polyangiaceae bacterium]
MTRDDEELERDEEEEPSGEELASESESDEGESSGDEGDAESESDSDEDDDEELERTTWWEDLRDFYLTFDRRTLGITRIFLGFFLIFDLFRRTPDWLWMFSDQGVLPTHYSLWRPQSSGFSIFNGFSTAPELAALWIFGLVVYLCLLVGYKTKPMQVIAAIYVASMNGRILLIENGGYVVHNLLMLWTAFLPLGDRFSVDALLTSLKTQKEEGAADLNDRDKDVAAWRLEPYVSIIGIIVLLQLAAIYAFNVIHKTGRAWHDGTAVHYVLYVDRMVNPLIGAVRDHTPPFVMLFLTKMVMGFEAGIPVALLSPLARVWAKRLAVIFVNVLHIGFGSTFVLGPFAWALCVFSVLLLSTEDWELAEKTMRREHRRRTVRYDPRSAAAFFWCRILKRMDRFELLSFEADGSATQGLAVTRPDGSKVDGTRATAEIVCAFPGGPVLGGPMMLPGVMQVCGLVGRLVDVVTRPFFARERELHRAPGRSYRKAGGAYEPTESNGYQDELRDDVGHPTVDAYFMREWLEEYYDGRFWQWLVYGGITFVGGFLTIYGGPMLKRLELGDTTEVWSGWERQDVAFWSGVVLLGVGLFLTLKPLVVMNATTPSPLTRKLIRVKSVAREGLAFLFLCGAINQALVELWVTRSLKAPQPFPIRELSHKMRYLQGWFMFSPNPVMDDGTIVVDAITVDGRRVDPFSIHFPDYTLRPPNYDLLNAKSFGYNQIWSDYFNRMHMPANTSYRKPMKEFMFALPERTGDPNDAIVKGAVYWLHDMNPRFGKTKSFAYEAQELFTFQNPDSEVQKRYRELTGGQDPPEIPLPTAVDPKGPKKPGT